MAILVDGSDKAPILDAELPVRSLKSRIWWVVRPRDGFVETLFNTALIRRRIRDPN